MTRPMHTNDEMDMDVAAQAELNYTLLKSEIAQMDLKELLEPHFSQLLKKTINTTVLANILHANGKMSRTELEKCLNRPAAFYRNLGVYQIVRKENAGELFIDALYKTKNYKVLQLLHSVWDKGASKNHQSPPQSDQRPTLSPQSFNISVRAIKSIIVKDAAVQVPESPEPGESYNLSTASSPSSSPIQVSILKANTNLPPRSSNEYIQTLRMNNLSRIEENSLDWTLARVVTTSNCDPGNARKFFETSEFHPEEQYAITKLLQSSFQLDLDKKTVGRPPREIYINTQSFTHVEWKFLSKVLLLCRNSLENLWLENVDYKEYFYGTTWMENLAEDEQPHLRFTKLKCFIFQADHYTVNASTFHSMLLLIKSLNYSLQNFWSKSKYQVQIWSEKINRCHILVDPANGILYSGYNVDDDLKDEMGVFFRPILPLTEAPVVGPVPVVKLYYIDSRLDLVTDEINPRVLTHLFLRCLPTNGVEITKAVMEYLAQFKVLQKLLLSANQSWELDLNQLDVLDNLSFVYFRGANCGGVAVDDFPWRKSVRTVILNECVDYGFITPGLEAVSSSANCCCLMLERNRQQNAGALMQPFNVSIMSNQDVSIKVMRQFCT